MSCEPQSPKPLRRLRTINQPVLHANFDRMLIHRGLPQKISDSVADINLDGIVAAIDNLNTRFEETDTPSSETLDNNCVDDALVFVRALNTLEEKISDSTFRALTNKEGYWKVRDLVSHHQRCLEIIERRSLSWQSNIENLGKPVSKDLKERAVRVFEIQSFRSRVLNFFLSSSCRSEQMIDESVSLPQ